MRVGLKVDLEHRRPPAVVGRRVHPQVRRIDDSPIRAESQQAEVISQAAVATTPDGSGVYGCRLYCDPRLLNV